MGPAVAHGGIHLRVRSVGIVRIVVGPVTAPRPSASDWNSSVFAPGESVKSVRKFRVESGSCPTVCACSVWPVVGFESCTAVAVSVTVTDSSTRPTCKGIWTLVVSVTLTFTSGASALEKPEAVTTRR